MLHIPEGEPLGTVLCVHSVFQDSEGSWAVAQALARAGFLARNVSLPPNRSFQDYVKVVEDEVARARPPVYLWGHSMGADLVAACRPEGVVARVTAGFPTEGPNQLALVGAWDELHTASEFSPPLLVLSLADHAGENFDVLGFQRAAAHFGGRDPGWADPFWGRALVALGLVLLMPLLPPRRRPYVVAPLAVALWTLDPLHTLSRALVVGWLLSSEAGQGLSRHQLVAILLALAAGLGVNAWPNWTSQPTLLVTLPLAVLLLVPQTWMKFAGALSPVALLVLGLAELLWAGRVLSILTYLPRRVWTAAPRLRLTVERVPRAQVALLVGLVAAGVLAWKQVLDAGYAPDPGQWKLLATRLASLLLVPLATYLVLARAGQGGSS